MAKTFKVNKNKCIGCGNCVISCPDAMILENDGKAKVVDSKKLEECEGKDACPYEAIEEIETPKK